MADSHLSRAQSCRALMRQHRTWFDSYNEWVDRQVCIDCGAPAKNRRRWMWVTETQCMDCLIRFGMPEKRGLASARSMMEREIGPQPTMRTV